MRKTLFILLLTLLLVFSMTSCRESGDTDVAVEKDGDVDDYFNTVLDESDDESREEEADSQEAATDEEEESSEEDSEDNDDSVSLGLDYGPTSCGDTICQYYETHSSCSEDCEKLEDTTLGDYPDFLEDVIIVIGDDAPSTDALTAAVIGAYLVTVEVDSETILASELTSFDDNDLILIGSPCTNLAIAELYHYGEDECDSIISDQNNAVIKLVVQDDNEIITITGYAEDDTLDASQMLTDTSYNLNGAEQWVNLYSDGEINVYYSRN